MSVGERIIELRKAQGLSQGQLAKLLGISRQAVSKWETDQTVPDTSKMILLADTLNTDIEFLATGRRNFGRRPPIVVNSVETVEKIVEKPVVKVVETFVEVPVVEYVERPVVRKVYRKQIIRNPIEFLVCGSICFLAGLLIGISL